MSIQSNTHAGVLPITPATQPVFRALAILDFTPASISAASKGRLTRASIEGWCELGTLPDAAVEAGLGGTAGFSNIKSYLISLAETQAATLAADNVKRIAAEALLGTQVYIPEP
jgi:hypothetical protein